MRCKTDPFIHTLTRLLAYSLTHSFNNHPTYQSTYLPTYLPTYLFTYIHTCLTTLISSHIHECTRVYIYGMHSCLIKHWEKTWKIWTSLHCVSIHSAIPYAPIELFYPWLVSCSSPDNKKYNWATKWYVQCMHRDDSDQPAHLPSLFRVFTVCWIGS